MINLPVGERGQVDISVREIAAMHEHTVVSYTYEKWTEITLKSGKTFDCRVDLKTVRDRIKRAVEQ